MQIPIMRGIIDRRILVNFRVDPTVLAGLLPAPFRPKLVKGIGMAGVCLIRLKDIRPRWLPSFRLVEGQDIGQIDVLTRLAGKVGLDEKEFEQTLRTRKYREAHGRALRHAYEEAGVTGVPMFLIGDQVLTGLQDRETLEAVIEEEMAR